jgi:hypothetical protein
MIFATLRNNRINYRNEKGGTISPGTQSKACIYLNLSLCAVVTLDIPPLKYPDKKILIDKTLPSHFPESLDEWIWDNRQYREKTLIFLIKKTVLKQIQEDWGKQVRFISAGQSLPYSDKKEVYEVCSPDFCDLFFCDKENLDYALYLSHSSEVPLLTKEFLGEERTPQNLEFEMGKSFLFKPQKKKKSGLLLFVIPLIPLFYFLFLWQQNKDLQNQWDLLEDQKKELLSQKTTRENELPWNEIEQTLLENQPEDIYNRLELLYPLFIDKAIILSISLQKDNFQLQAKGKESLNILEELRTTPGIESVTLSQSREEESQEIFNLTGRWK